MNANVPLVIENSLPVINPSVLENIIGQDNARKKLSFFIRSITKDHGMPTFLFTGSQGLGKTYTAHKVAEALNRELIDINCGIISTSEDFIQKVIVDRVYGENAKTILFDEAQKLSYDISTLLLTLLNPNKEHKNHIRYRNLDLEWDLNKINVIFATTDAYKIPKALLNRCTEIYFCLYTNDELFTILQNYLKDISFSEELSEELAYACRGRARDAYILSTYIDRYCQMNDSKLFTVDAWREVKTIMGLHSYGLKSQEVEMLKILKVNSPMSLNNISIKMGLNTFNVEEEIEPRIRELGLIENGTRGRSLTKKGMKPMAIWRIF